MNINEFQQKSKPTEDGEEGREVVQDKEHCKLEQSVSEFPRNLSSNLGHRFHNTALSPKSKEGMRGLRAVS